MSPWEEWLACGVVGGLEFALVMVGPRWHELQLCSALPLGLGCAPRLVRSVGVPVAVVLAWQPVVVALRGPVVVPWWFALWEGSPVPHLGPQVAVGGCPWLVQLGAWLVLLGESLPHIRGWG